MIAAALLTYAIVSQNASALRAAPHDSAPQQAVLWQGEPLEIRGHRQGYVQVYDHRLERGGYIRESQVKPVSLRPEDAPELLAVVRFLRDTPGDEALGIAYAAAYLQAAPAGSIGAEPLDALGTMAERLAQRASTVQMRGSETALAAHLDVAVAYGLGMRSIERENGVQVCYDGEMFRRVLALEQAEPDQRARAALGLTRPECEDPHLPASAREAHEAWQAERLAKVPASGVSPGLAAQVRMRRAAVLASLAFLQGRHREAAAASEREALDALAGIDHGGLDDEQIADYNQAALQVAASRWAADRIVARPGKLGVTSVDGASSGETCVLLHDAAHPAEVLARRCTYGQVLLASASASPNGGALALAVQPLAGWRELWVFRRGAEGWDVSVLPPGPSDPELGYIECAGWLPAGDRLLTVREFRADSRYQRRYEVLRVDTLAVEVGASRPDLLQAFVRFQDPLWKAGTLALR